jgi:hypothetical protein
MKRIVSLSISLLACALLFGATLSLAACHNGSSSKEQGEHEAIVVGTVVDAATGKSVANVRVEGPGGHKTSTDDSGRFRLEGLEIGATGEVKATAPDGRTASVTLRRLSDKRLEIVLHLKRP